MVEAYILVQTEVGKAADVARHIAKITGVTQAEDVFERSRHRTRTGSAGKHKRAVDVEQEERDRLSAGQASLRTLPARGPLADGSSSKVTRWPSFSSSKLPCTELR